MLNEITKNNILELNFRGKQLKDSKYLSKVLLCLNYDPEKLTQNKIGELIGEPKNKRLIMDIRGFLEQMEQETEQCSNSLPTDFNKDIESRLAILEQKVEQLMRKMEQAPDNAVQVTQDTDELPITEDSPYEIAPVIPPLPTWTPPPSFPKEKEVEEENLNMNELKFGLIRMTYEKSCFVFSYPLKENISLNEEQSKAFVKMLRNCENYDGRKMSIYSFPKKELWSILLPTFHESIDIPFETFKNFVQKNNII